jgi:hypothetical protein
MKIRDLVFEKGDTMFICAMNPSLAKEGRSKLPELLENHLIPVYFD